jgi:Matrixin
MRFSYLVALTLTLVGASTFWYQSKAAICPVPIAYHIGVIDSHFNITREEAQAQLLEAERVWEAYAGRELFYYDEEAVLTVDFVFDERQATADFEASQRQVLDVEKEENDALFEKIKQLQDEYQNRTNEYQSEVARYERRLSTYNEEVSQYNDQGGAPANVFDTLEREKNALAREANDLNETASQLNEMAETINELSEQGNKLVEAYNRKVEVYNEEFGYSREFTQGDYQSGRISVYKFSNNTELQKVLVHEFGHALGVDHVEGESSVMYYLLGDTSTAPVLSQEDKDAFVTVCGTGDEWQNKLRRTIRNIINTINF